ncbi:MAG: CsgG/HfaB family protein [Treponema sp.]|jgi:hypothetical protein|nr:CsgG/HfaB family protein [Treponema sp.]
MAKYIVLSFFVLLSLSCATTGKGSLNDPYRPISENEMSNYVIVETIQVNFTAEEIGPLFIGNMVTKPIKERAYLQLKGEAGKKYQGTFDIKNIIIILKEEHDHDINEWIATGDVVVPNIARETAIAVESSLTLAAEELKKLLPKDVKIAIMYITSSDTVMTEYIADELEYILVNDGYVVINRTELNRIRAEQNLQLSGEVDDETAVSIGKFIGASIIITGSISGTESTKRLRLRAIDTETTQVIAVVSERL